MKKARYFYIVSECGTLSDVAKFVTDGCFPSIEDISEGLRRGGENKLPSIKYMHEFKSRQDFIDFCGDEKLCDDFDKLDCMVKTKYKKDKPNK